MAAAINRSPRRYVSVGALPGRGHARSAWRTCGACESASLNTATVPTPSLRQVRMTLTAISPRLATSTRVITTSHPVDAVAAGAFDRLVVDRAQTHSQNRVRVAWVDDPIVVDTPRHEQREGLAFDLLLHLLAQLCVGVFVEVSTERCGRLPGDDREHAGQLLRAHHRGLGVR